MASVGFQSKTKKGKQAPMQLKKNLHLFMKCAKYALKLETDALQKNEDFPS